MINEETELVVEATEEEVETPTEVTEENEEAEEKGVEYWKAEALKNKAILDRNKNKVGDKKTGEFGYDVKAYLKASGIKESEFDFVKSELKASGMKEYDSLLSNDYFMAKLEKQREISKTQEAIPKGNRGTGVATDSVEYWMAKPIEEVPADKRRDVVNAKLAKDKTQGKFYNS